MDIEHGKYWDRSWSPIRDVPGFPGYRVGADGSVWSAWAHNGHQARKLSENWKRLKVKPQKKTGYLYVNLYRNRTLYRKAIHDLVLTVFKGSRPTGMHGCHNNGIGSDCQLSNLRWDTPLGNQHDRILHGTDCRGAKAKGAKLTEANVISIRKQISMGARKKDVAFSFFVSPSTISAIARGATWAWLKQASNG
jgi:hypothetical protein